MNTKKSDEKHGKIMALLRKHLPLDDKNEMKSVEAKFQQLFKYHPPSYEEKRVICQVDKDFIKKLGNKILENNELTDQITEGQMYRCISKNITLFKYVVVAMENSQYSDDVKNFADKFVKTKTTSKPLPIPQINANKSPSTDTTESKEKASHQDIKKIDKDTSSSNKVKPEVVKKEMKSENTVSSNADDKNKNQHNESCELFLDEISDEDGYFLYDEDNPLGYVYYFDA